MAGSLFSSGIGTVLQSSGGGGAAAAIVGLLFLVIPLAFAAVALAGMWKVFTKAGQPGWAAIIPVYNTYILVVEIADRDIVWLLLSIFVPFAIVVPMIDVAKAFGKGTGYGLGLAFLAVVFFPMLGFGSAQYRGSPA